MSKNSLTPKPKVFLTQDDSFTNSAIRLRNSPDKPSTVADLSLLKKKHDFIKQENIKKTQHLEWLDSKLSELKSTANSIQTDILSEKNRYVSLKEEIKKASELLNEQLELRKVYDYMFNRNKSEGTNMDKKVRKFSENLKIAKLKMDFENGKARKSKEKKYEVKNKFKDLKVCLEEDAKKIFSHISNLENNIMSRKELVRRFEERTKRQAEIIELAARNDRDLHEKTIRERIIMNKMLLDLLTAQANKEKNEGKEIENAFLDIRTKTALTNPKEILQKFVNREQSNAKLIGSVEKAESTLEKVKKEYNVFKSQLKNVLLLNDSENKKRISGQNLKAEIAWKNLEKSKIYNRKLLVTFKEISKWNEKICEKLGIPMENEFDKSVFNISLKISELTQVAIENTQHFQENVKRHTLKKTVELLKEIYKEPLSPSRP